MMCKRCKGQGCVIQEDMFRICNNCSYVETIILNTTQYRIGENHG